MIANIEAATDSMNAEQFLAYMLDRSDVCHVCAERDLAVVRATSVARERGEHWATVHEIPVCDDCMTDFPPLEIIGSDAPLTQGVAS